MAQRRTLKERITTLIKKDEEVVSLSRDTIDLRNLEKEIFEEDPLDVLFAMNEAELKREVYVEYADPKLKGEIQE